MKSASLHELKKELQLLDPDRLAELCIHLAKYKKDNKELLSYLVFDSADKPGFMMSVKKEISSLFAEINTENNLYFAKKSIRKILRFTNKYIKYAGDKQTEADLLIYFCQAMKQSGLPFHKNQVLVNLYESQVKKANKAVGMLHEDLQYDYSSDLQSL